MANDAAKRIIVTLVHGTWGRDSKWVSPSSALCRALDADIQHEVILNNFVWSGRNSASGRSAAAGQLATQLMRQTCEYPDDVHIAIGHSHGGNVILQAIEFARLSDSIGVICISTPFLHITPRNLGSEKEQSSIVLGIAATVTLLFFLTYSKLFGTDGQGPIPVYTSILLTALCAWPFAKWHETVVWSAENFAVSVSQDQRLLILRTPGDEASLVISAFQSFGLIFNTLVRRYAHFVTWVHESAYAASGVLYRRKRNKDWLLWLIPALNLTAVLLWARKPISAFNVYLVSAEFVAVFTWFMLAPLMSVLGYPAIMTISIFVPILVPIAALASVPLGFDFIAILLFYDVSAESIPPGDWRVTQLVPQRDHDLNHSSLYDDPSAISTIVGWVSGLSSA